MAVLYGERLELVGKEVPFSYMVRWRSDGVHS